VSGRHQILVIHAELVGDEAQDCSTADLYILNKLYDQRKGIARMNRELTRGSSAAAGIALAASALAGTAGVGTARAGSSGPSATVGPTELATACLGYLALI
jgi:hypothetical protein